ncbi:MAG TPA: GyrI-like domain-containing protein [Chryseosolibacter sp.]|nr:GyrI-like domain-containing protein [Chryseosolibacter sp.]
MGEKIEIEPFKIVGISSRTTNTDGQSVIDLAKLWNRVRAENLPSVIPNKLTNDIYTVYTDYMTDHRGAFTAIIGCKVHSLDNIPPGLMGREFNGGQYRKFTAKGKMPDILIRQWQEIWNENKKLGRKYTADFEVYGRKSHDRENAEVNIFIAVK